MSAPDGRTSLGHADLGPAHPTAAVPGLPPGSPELEKLRALLDAHEVKLGVHIRKMNSPGTPVYRAIENVVPAFAVLVASFTATALVHYYLGAVILAIGCWWWLAKQQPRMRDAVFDRTAALVLSADRQFDFWWSRGVLSLYAKGVDGQEFAAMRRNDWRDWVRTLPAALERLEPVKE